MNDQHQVILSLGSNQGNRLENIERCIVAIHNELGTVIRVSRLYETPAWGFDSDSFYNCALFVHTHKSAHQVLEEALSIELRLGRIRSAEEGYQPRLIDIDVVSFDEEIIATEKLKIPHPEMQNRMFVLMPMADLNFDWKHPVLHKYLHELLVLSEDKSSCKVIQNLEAPIAKIKLDSFNYIAVEGNIGAGKTTLVKKIAEDFNAKAVFERFEDNPFLPKFYEDEKRYAFSLEMSFLADRYKQITDDLEQFDLFKDSIIADYHIFKSLIFSKATLPEEEFRLFKVVFDIIYKDIPKPDLYIYLYQNTSGLLGNIKKRGREYERGISSEYLEKITSGYLDFIKAQKDLNVLVIDVTDKDFLNNQEDYVFVLEEIRNKISN